MTLAMLIAIAARRSDPAIREGILTNRTRAGDIGSRLPDEIAFADEHRAPALVGVRSVRHADRVAEPRAGLVRVVLVLEDATYDEALLAHRVVVGGNLAVGLQLAQ